MADSPMVPSTTPLERRDKEDVPRAGLSARASDRLFRGLTMLFAVSTLLLILGIAGLLVADSLPSLKHAGLGFFTRTQWDPVAPDSSKPIGNLFGALPFLYGTLLTSAIALVIAVPLGVGAAIFLSEIAPRWLSAPLSFLIELLAGIPSIVYGFWALTYLVPCFKDRVEPWLNAHFGQMPFFALSPGAGFSGQDFLAAGVILSLMILPYITAVSRDILRAVPAGQREAAFLLGATRWEVIRDIVLRYGTSGVMGAVILGLGRALGETMAVTIVIGSVPNFPVFGNAGSFSLLRPGYTMSALLADQYPNPNSDLHRAALTEIALLLFAITILVNALARVLVWLTAAHVVGGGADRSAKVRNVLIAVLRWGGTLSVAGILGYQVASDALRHGVRGFFGAAEAVSAALLVLATVNRLIPSTAYFLRWRKLASGFALGLACACAMAASVALLMLLFFVARDGMSSLNLQFLRPPDPAHPELGGMLHALVGTGELILAASLFGIPVGILGGIFLTEFGSNRLGWITRFAADLLNGVPSIVVGIFAYALIVIPTRSNFGFAGAFALGVLMIPVVMRTTEELLRLVPMSLREASLSLGATQARTVWKVVLPTARSGILTGALLAVARVAGETAPLLMVGCNSSLWVTDLRQRISSLPVQIYVLRDDPTMLALRQSWGVALVLVLLVLVFSGLARLATRDKMHMNA